MRDVEIERKFLVTDLSPLERVYDDDGSPGTEIEQGYLVSEPHRTLRVRVTDDQATLTFKGPREGSVRIELETGIPVDMARHLLQLCAPRLVTKVRYPVVEEGHLWVIDVFRDLNEGLVIAEVELDAPSEELVVPDWCGDEVTDDDRYYNQYLAEHPFSLWT